jgi:hypothetical protein
MSPSSLILDDYDNDKLNQHTMPATAVVHIGENLRTKVNIMVSGDQCNCLLDDDSTVSTEDSYDSCASLERGKSSTYPTRSLENPSASSSRRYSVQSQLPGDS